MRAPVALLFAVALAACTAQPPAPEWEAEAADALEAFQRAWLRGEIEAAERSYARAVHAVSATGRPDRLARVHLARCGVEAAALAFVGACADPVALAATGGPEEMAYGRFLTGRWEGAHRASLPAAYRALPGAGSDAAAPDALRAIASPVSRLVAASVLFRAGRLPPAGVDLAVDTASDAGLRRALLAWLGVQEQLALAAGDAARVTAIRARAAIAGGR